MRENNDQVCERADELISLLYGELGEKEARQFDHHLQECARCESELANFSQIRESIVSWRDESLGAAWSRAASSEDSMVAAPVRSRTVASPSAFTALREFFSLAPLWMKGAIVFASLLFCVSVIVTLAHLRERSQPVVQTPLKESSDQLALRVEQLKNELAQVKATQKQSGPVKEASGNDSGAVKTVKRNEFVAKSGNTKANNLNKPLTRQERQELAADLGLLASRDDDDLDLVTDTINQAPQ